MKTLKLYVWTNFCPDYTGGLAFAIAENEEKARELIKKQHYYEPYEWGDLAVHSLNKKIAYSVSGGS